MDTEEFARIFSIDQYENPYLVLIDENWFFSDCDLNPVKGRIIKIDREQKYKIDKAPRDAVNVIVLHRLERFKRGYILHFWRPVNNNFLVVKIVKDRTGVISSKMISYGSY